MSWFKALKPDSLHDLFIHEIKCVYDMEQKQLDVLPRLAKAATDGELRMMLERHIADTNLQVERLDRVCGMLDTKLEADTNHSARGLAADADLVVSMRGDDAVRDAAIILAAQSAEHLEIARYGTLCTWARYCGCDDIAQLLHDSLEEEKRFDQQLTVLAESAVNVEAVR